MKRVATKRFDEITTHHARHLWLWVGGLAAVLIAMTFLPRISGHSALVYSFYGAALFLLLHLAVTSFYAQGKGIIPSYKIVISRPHWVQALMHLCVFGYWGWYWDPVYQHIPLIIGQLIFVHAFDMLISWGRGKAWILGFGRFPIIFSTNLFLWFRDDVFFLQFLMIAFGVLAKEYFTWTRNGRRAHIFNPSAISLSVASMMLIFTGAHHLSWGPAISNTLNLPEHIYLLIFCLGLVVQGLFGVTLVTMAAGLTLFLVGVLYYSITGVYFFLTSDIPIAVFLGLHLLVTDPATSPRKNIGKFIFGALYGLSVMILFEVLDLFGQPTFYDKLLAVPLLNLSVIWIDKLSVRLSATLPQIPSFSPAQLNRAHMAIWIIFFLAWSASGRVGNTHPGRTAQFWQTACKESRRHACINYLGLLENECALKNNPIACALAGNMLHKGTQVPSQPNRAWQFIKRSCDLGYKEACLFIRTLPKP